VLTTGTTYYILSNNHILARQDQAAVGRYDLMSRPGVLGVGLGALEDNSQAAVIIYVDKTSSAKPQLPAQVDNVPVSGHIHRSVHRLLICEQ
jgi:hypothetical protein